MPIAPEYRHLYRGDSWRRARARTLARAQFCCERCGKPHGVELLGSAGAWFDPVTLRWIRPGPILVDRRPPIERGLVCLRPCGFVALKRSQLGVAHINHRPGDNRARNLAAWCQECHLEFDLEQHAETRKERKDRARPLLAVAETITAETSAKGGHDERALSARLFDARLMGAVDARIMDAIARRRGLRPPSSRPRER